MCLPQPFVHIVCPVVLSYGTTRQLSEIFSYCELSELAAWRDSYQVFISRHSSPVSTLQT